MCTYCRHCTDGTLTDHRGNRKVCFLYSVFTGQRIVWRCWEKDIQESGIMIYYFYRGKSGADRGWALRRYRTGELELLAEMRIMVFRAANSLTDMGDLRGVTALFIKKRRLMKRISPILFSTNIPLPGLAASDFPHTALFHNRSGDKRYIIDMRTSPGCRRKRLASRVPGLPAAAARAKKVPAILPEAADTGLPGMKKGFGKKKHFPLQRGMRRQRGLSW